tara:strand:- start:2358 stop:2870 length:513 start_codon:yes stop_codon:yes gene_type:complete
MKFIYTESAVVELEKLNEEIKRNLENKVKKEKYIIGDDSVEITGYDVKLYNDFYKKSSQKANRYRLVRMVASLYVLLGAFILVGGVFYENLIEMVAVRPQQAAIIIGGFSLIVIGMVVVLLIKKKEAEMKDYQQDIDVDLESILTVTRLKGFERETNSADVNLSDNKYKE